MNVPISKCVSDIIFCSQVLQILCSNHDRLQPIRTRNNVALEREDSSSVDFEEGEMHISETPTFGGCDSTDIKTHFALAMLGVDDCNTVIPRNSLDHRGIDRLHSSKYLEAYLEGRYSPSSSLVKWSALHMHVQETKF